MMIATPHNASFVPVKWLICEDNLYSLRRSWLEKETGKFIYSRMNMTVADMCNIAVYTAMTTVNGKLYKTYSGRESVILSKFIYY